MSPDTPDTAAPALPDIVLLHGANGCRAEMQPWCQVLASQGFKAHAINLSGHGGKAIPPALTMKHFGDEVIAELDRLKLTQPVILMGYSFGGLVALHVASHHPARVKGVVSLATKHIFDAKAVQHFTHLLQVPRLTAMPHRRDHLSRVHYPNDWRKLVEALHAFFASLATHPPITHAELQAIACPALVLSGAQDQLANAQETMALHGLLPRAEVALFQGVAHPSEAVPAMGLAQAVKSWAGLQSLLD